MKVAPKRQTLANAVKTHGMAELAELLGCSPVTIHRGVRSGKNIMVINDADGIRAVETKPFPDARYVRY